MYKRLYARKRGRITTPGGGKESQVHRKFLGNYKLAQYLLTSTNTSEKMQLHYVNFEKLVEDE